MKSVFLIFCFVLCSMFNCSLCYGVFWFCVHLVKYSVCHFVFWGKFSMYDCLLQLFVYTIVCCRCLCMLIGCCRCLCTYDCLLQMFVCTWLFVADVCEQRIVCCRCLCEHDWLLQMFVCTWLVAADVCVHVIGCCRCFCAHDWLLLMFVCTWLVIADVCVPKILSDHDCLLQMFVCTRTRCTDKTRFGMMIVMPSASVRMPPLDTTDVKKGMNCK